MKEAYQVYCDCGSTEVTMTGSPRVHAYCHCEDCRELLQVPYHSVLAWDADQVEITRGRESVKIFKHPAKNMTRAFCMNCGEVLFNTNAMGWKIVSQLLFLKRNENKLPTSFQPNAHFFYDRRIVDIDDLLPKR